MREDILIPHQGLYLEGHVSGVKRAKAWVIFSHGSGSSRFSVRNNWVAQELNKQGFATLLFDLLTAEEDQHFHNRFNLPLLAARLVSATEWLVGSRYYQGLPIAYFGASTGGGSALIAASEVDARFPVYSVISRGGRPDLVEAEVLSRVFVPVLLIVGSLDEEVIELNQQALTRLPNAQLILVPNATHLFEEHGALSEVVRLTLQWLTLYLPQRSSHAVPL